MRVEVEDYCRQSRATPNLLEQGNLVEITDPIIRSALSRHESRGPHYTLDYPETALVPQGTVLVP